MFVIKVKDLSIYRKQLMGIAILMIMLCHNSLSFSNQIDTVNNLLRNFLQIGVDIFILLSGFGCFFSMKKSKSVKVFYIKRLKKIIPTYIFIVFIYAIFNCVFLDVSLKEYVEKYSLITFWTKGTLAEWFIAAIIVLYALFPIFYYLIESHIKIYVSIMILIIVCSLIISILLDKQFVYYTVNEIFISRIATFGLGIYLGKSVFENNMFKIKHFYIIFYGLICLWGINYFFNFYNMLEVERILSTFLSLFLTLYIIQVFKRIRQRDIFHVGNNLLIFLGGVTLEIYLIHEKLMGICYFLVSFILKSQEFVLLYSNIIAIILAPIIAYIVQKILVLLSSIKNNMDLKKI